MSAYENYAKATGRLCAAAADSAAPARFNDRLNRLYNKIRKSPLTVYQKEQLLQRLDQARATALQPPLPDAGTKHRGAELLAA